MATNESFMQRNYFLLRRLHSLTGVMPIGVFLLFHLTTNASIVWGMLDSREGATALERGVRTFQAEVDFIHSTPFLLLVEVFGLWLPIAFHSVLGVYYARTGRPNTGAYPYQANWRYTLQRTSGYIGVLFIFYHVATLRWGWTWMVPGGVEWKHNFAASTMAQILRGGEQWTAAGAVVSVAYFLCVSMLVFHLANGLWTSAITWGLTISARAQKQWGYVCAGVGAALMLAGWASVLGFATIDPAKAREIELRHAAGKGGVAEVLPAPRP